MKKFAADFYSNRKGNCAQSVAAAWHAKKNSHADLVGKLSDCGHGKAPEGICGALHAVHCIAGEKAGIFNDEFVKASGGDVKCKDIRKAGRLSCAGCVETAAGLLEEHL